MLHTNHSPLNLHEYVIVENDTIMLYRDHHDCTEQQIPETLHHFLFSCPKHDLLSRTMISNVQNICNYHNIIKINDQSDDSSNQRESTKLLPFTTDISNPIYAEQFLFPDFSMDNEMRVQIIKETINFVKQTQRIKLSCTSSNEH